MAVIALCGFEAQDELADRIAGSGTRAYNTTTKRTGSASIRCNPASGGQGYVQTSPSPAAGFDHFGLYVASLPTVDRQVFGTANAGTINVRLTSTGTLAVYVLSTLIGTSSTALLTGQWYWIGVRNTTGTSVVFLQIDGADEVTGTATVTSTTRTFGCAGIEASAIDIYVDDIVVDSAGFLAPSKVALLLPISDNARAALWTGGAGGTSNLYDALNNTPPIGTP